MFVLSLRIFFSLLFIGVSVVLWNWVSQTPLRDPYKTVGYGVAGFFFFGSIFGLIQSFLSFGQKRSASAKEDSSKVTGNITDELKKLGELREKGILTEKEFEQQKKKLLS